MKHYLLPLFLSAATLASVAAPSADDLSTVSAAQSVKVSQVKVNKAKMSKKLAKGVSLSTVNRLKRIDNRLGSKIMKQAARKATVSKVAPENAAIYESFEGWDGTTVLWLPDGWTRQNAVEDAQYTWLVGKAEPMYGLYPTDGDNMIFINFGTAQDEWLISPLMETKEGMVFSFEGYIDPMFLFNLNDDKVDWDAMEFIGEPEVSATLQVMVKAEGDEEWTMLHDFADDYKDKSLEELFTLTPEGLEHKSVSLDEFAGQKIQVALRYVGSDGNMMCFDELTVGYPQLDGVSFSEPYDIQYWGFERGIDLMALNAAIAQVPVFSPLTWINATYIEGAEYSWKYCDPVTAEMVDGGAGDELTVTYVPDYTSDNSKRNNWFYPPVLSASAPYSSPATVTSLYDYLQAGGKSERILNDGSLLEVSLMPFLFSTQGISIATVDYEKLGDATLPIFGHNANTSKFWLDYTMNGEEPGSNDDVQLDGILNFIYPSQGASMVVNGADVFAKGEVADDAEFTLRIFALDETFVFDPDTQTPVATATCLGKDILREEGSNGINTLLCVPFNFDTPVALKAQDDAQAYVVYLTGFNSDKVEYFAPVQSYYPNPDYLCHGWVTKRIRVDSENYRFSVAPMANYENDLGEMYGAFAIGLHAEHPWLTTETSKIELYSDGTPVNVALGSYYDGSKLTVEAPTGVEASVAGRYDECVLTLKKDHADVIPSGDVKVSGPGVELSIPLSYNAGISDVTTAGDAEVAGIYDLTGRKVSDSTASGIYIMKYADGTAKKVTVK